jgi:hypothetical protein
MNDESPTLYPLALSERHGKTNKWDKKEVTHGVFENYAP